MKFSVPAAGTNIPTAGTDIPRLGTDIRKLGTKKGGRCGKIYLQRHSGAGKCTPVQGFVLEYIPYPGTLA